MARPEARYNIVAVDKTKVALASVKKNLSGVKKSALSLKTAFVGLTAGLAAGAGFTQLIQKGREFSASIADLSAITGAVGKDLEFLTNASKEFGRTTTLSATQAAEAFKLVASAKPDLLSNVKALKAVTKEAIVLAEATGSSLPEAAKTLGASLNQFGVEADQAGRFINVLAAGAKLGASEVQDTAQALKDAGIVASQAGLSFEQTNAAIQALAKDAIKGQKAGVGLRNILTILQTQTDNSINPAIVGLNKALENLAKKNLTATEKVKLFGRETLVVANSLIKNRDTVVQLSTALQGTNVAYEQAKIKAGSFDGQLKSLSSAIEGAALNLFDALKPALTAVVNALIVTARWVGENINVLTALAKIVAVGAALHVGFKALPVAIALTTTAIQSATKAIATFRLALLAGVPAMQLFNTSLGGTSVAAVAATGALGKLKIAAGVLFAAFAGWQIGTILREKFAVARIAGLAFIGAMLKGWEHLKFGAQAAWEAITASWSIAIDNMKRLFASFLSGVASALSKIPGLGKVSESLRAYTAEIKSSKTATQQLGENIDKLRQARNAEITKIDENITALVRFELQNEKAKQATQSLKQEIKKVPEVKPPKDLQTAADQVKNLADSEANRNAVLAQTVQAQESVNQSLGQYKTELTNTSDAANQSFSSQQQLAQGHQQQLAGIFSNGFFSFIDNGFKGMVDSFQNALFQMARQAAGSELNSLFGGGGGSAGGGGLFSSLFGGGGGGGGLFSSLFGGFFAAGGPVAPGRPILVGEQGPELFMPRQSGNIVPNGQLRGSGGDVVINMNVSTPDANSFRRSEGNIAAQLATRMNRAKRNL